MDELHGFLADVLGNATAAMIGVFGNALVALIALAGIVGGFLYQEIARRRAHHADVLAEADSSIARVIAAKFPIIKVEPDGWTLTEGERLDLRKELERRAANELVSAAQAAMVALTKASVLAPELREYVLGGPKVVIENSLAIAARLARVRTSRQH